VGNAVLLIAAAPRLLGCLGVPTPFELTPFRPASRPTRLRLASATATTMLSF
jgi:hypothetical protein